MAAVLVIASLTLRWWPEDLSDPTFGAYRSRFLDDWADDGSHPWHNHLFWSWFAFGYVVQVLAVLAAVPAVARRGRAANALVAVAVLACGWQLVGVRGATLVNTTIAPYLGPLAGLVLLSAWALGRAAVRAEAPVPAVPPSDAPTSGRATVLGHAGSPAAASTAPVAVRTLAVVATALVLGTLLLPWRGDGPGPTTFPGLVEVTVRALEFLPQTTWRDRIDWSWVLVGWLVQLGGAAAAAVLAHRGRRAERALAAGLVGCAWHGLAMVVSLRNLPDLHPLVPWLGVLAALPLAAALRVERRSVPNDGRPADGGPGAFS